FDFDGQIAGTLPNSVRLETEGIDGTHSNDSMQLWQHWNTDRMFSDGNHYAVENQTLSLEAESAMHIFSGQGSDWHVESTETNSSGSGYMTTSADGFDSGNLSTGSRLSWDVEFDSPGLYWIWARLQQHDESSNAIHVGLDGTIQTLGHEGLGVNATGWSWGGSISNQTMNVRASLNVTTPGRHSVDVWVKEGGVDFDRLELTRSQTWIPSSGSPTNYSTVSHRWNDLTLRS
ncbi:uncharacterized protein METZ01_LOCUS509479, partial [marine metagenome]